jgi:tetratricopeptide (TPR) repeat protein
VAVASPDRRGNIERKGSLTICRACRRPIVTVTEEDGTVQVLSDLPPEKPSPAEESRKVPGESAGGVREDILSSPPRIPTRTDVGFQYADDVPDEERIVAFSQILKRRDGTRRTQEEAVKLYGERSVWIAELNEALEERLRGPKPLSIPPRVFVSYRWNSQEQDVWVEQLVRELRNRGYFVVFDRTDCTPDTTVPEFVSNLATCQTFLAVLDPGYCARLGTPGIAMEDGWVFDEFNSASHLRNGGFLRIIGFLRSGNVLPPGFRFPAPGKLGNTVDVSSEAKLESALEQIFEPVRNLPPQHQIDTMAGLIAASHNAVKAGRLEEARQLARSATYLIPEIIDGHAQEARAAIAAQDGEGGFDAAVRALVIDPDCVEMLSFAAGCAYHLRQFNHSLSFSNRLLNLQESGSGNRFLPMAHYHMGNALDDLGESWAGIAHLEIARRLQPGVATFHNDTGLAYRHVDDLARALACFDDGLAISPQDENLLVNRAAAAVEAGDLVLFEASLQDLERHHPGHPSSEYLSRSVEVYQREGGSPPKLVPRVSHEAFAGIARCDHCPAEIPVKDSSASLCAGCGAQRLQPTGKCSLCESEGQVVPALGFFMCPFCRDGHIKLIQNMRGGLSA